MGRQRNKDNWESSYRPGNINTHSGRDSGEKVNDGIGVQNNAMRRLQQKSRPGSGGHRQHGKGTRRPSQVGEPLVQWRIEQTTGKGREEASGNDQGV